MAEFEQVMRQWKRMCDAQGEGGPSVCMGCPLFEGHGCGAVYDLPADTNWEGTAKTVMQWAAEHPEPRYPTFREWLISIGVISQMSTHSVIADTLSTTPIPADIAEKLGIEPKEG